MIFNIKQTTLTDEIKDKIFAGFGTHSIEQKGINGLQEQPIPFEIHLSDELASVIVAQLFWGQLHIKYLYTEKKFRGQGMATQLMNHVLLLAKELGCNFAFIETLNFQALSFYQKLGFILEYSRGGYIRNVSFNYLRKDL